MSELKKEVVRKGQEEFNIEIVNILFLDVSSTCTGYSIAEVNFSRKTAKIKKAGALWLNPDWAHQEKYSYVFNALVNYFWIVEQIDHIVIEQYSINPKKMAGITVVPEMCGVIKCAAWENGVKVSSILPQTWRSILKIKPIIENKKRDYKLPAKKKVLEYFNVPETSISNITGGERQTPSDLYDAVALGLAWAIKNNFTITTSNVEFNTHVGYKLGE